MGRSLSPEVVNKLKKIMAELALYFEKELKKSNSTRVVVKKS